MSFGATNFSLALPDNLIKRLSDGLVDIIDDIKNNPELLMRNSNEFMYQFLLNNPSVVKLNMDKAIQLSNGNYSGSEIVNNRQVFFDLKIDRKLEAPQSIIRRSGSKRSYIYKLISVSDESLYYTKIGGESMSSYYNMTKDKFTNPSDTLVIDSSIPNIQVASTSDSSFDITDSVAKVIRDEFGDSAFMATLNMYEDPTRRDSVKKLVQLSGNKLILSTNDVYYIDNTIDDIS